MRWGAAVFVLVGCGRIGFDATGDGGVPGEGDPLRQCAVDVDVGREHGCMIDTTGGVWCWGHNTKGQIDPAGPEYVLTPTKLGLSAPATKLALGRQHSCALLADRTVWCWGYNNVGQLGDGTMTNGLVRAQVSEPVDDVAAAAYMTCARRISDHALECWGANQDGELGVPATPTPVLRPGSAQTREMAFGHRHNCLIEEAGALRCWGRSGNGQLLDAPGGTELVPITGLDPIASVTTTSRTSCAAEVDGDVKCWGHNRAGQLGDSTQTDSSTFVTVPVTGAVEVQLGIEGACARRADGSVTCWGTALAGDGTFERSPQPRASLLAGATKLALGYHLSCAIANGEAVCWGPNGSGELGRGTRAQVEAPVNVDPSLAGSSLDEVSVGFRHVCIRSGANVSCWGDNDEGQLGDGTRTRRVAPTPVATGLATVEGIATGNGASCAWGNGVVRCWGSNGGKLRAGGNAIELSPITSSLGGTTVSRVAIGPAHACAVIDNRVLCVGGNDAGQLGNGSMTSTSVPAMVVILGNATDVSVGDRHSCAVVAGNVWCWGANTGGQLGDGTQTSSTTPVMATISAVVTSVSAGNDHACALTQGGQVYCWGENDYGELGVGDNMLRAAPTLVTLPLPATSISAGSETTCAHLVSDEIMCWGLNANGQLGIGTTDNENTPQAIALVNTTEVEAGGTGVCARRGNALACWGSQQLLADGDDSASRPLPVLVTCP